MKTISNEAVVAKFKDLLRHLQGCTEENHKKIAVSVADLLSEVVVRNLPNAPEYEVRV